MAAKCYEIRLILKEIDDGFDVDFDFERESYVITFNGGLFQTVYYKDVDRALFEDIRHTFWLNKQDAILDYVDDINAAKDAAQERHLSNIAESMAKDIYKPVMQNYFYGG